MNRNKFNELRKLALKLATELDLQSSALSDSSVDAIHNSAQDLILALDEYGHDQGYLDDEDSDNMEIAFEDEEEGED